MKIKAVEMGILNGSRVRPGKVVDLPDGLKVPAWAVALDETKPEPEVTAQEKKRAGTKVVRTLSDITKRDYPVS